MIIYEVNCTIDADVFADFYQWLTLHVQKILCFDGFQHADLAEQHDDSLPKHKKYLTIYYHINTQADLDHYLTHHATAMRDDGIKRFPHQFTASRRVLTLQKTITRT
jgi:hypothetical protein